MLKLLLKTKKNSMKKLVSDAVIEAEKTIADALNNQTVTDTKDQS